jgi:hypothetical protein
MTALGFAGAGDDQPFRDYLSHNRSQRHGTHSYTPEDFGLSAAQLADDFAFYEGAPA